MAKNKNIPPDLTECFNPCICVLDDGTKHGKVMFGFSSYKTMKSYCEYQKQFREIERGLFSDTAGNRYKVIFNEH